MSIKQIGAIAIAALTVLFLSGLSPVDAQSEGLLPELVGLQRRLEQSGFTVKWERLPSHGAYGSLQIKNRTIWINPVVVELGIAEPTLVHEAVHAVQYCETVKLQPNAETLKPFGLALETPTFLRPYFMRYSGDRRHVEREAYTVQIRGDRIAYVSQLLQKHCGGSK